MSDFGKTLDELDSCLGNVRQGLKAIPEYFHQWLRDNSNLGTVMKWEEEMRRSGLVKEDR
jgi:hypothetical protein